MASDYFLELEGIKGESTDAKHQGWLEIETWAWGETQEGAGSRSTSGAASRGRVSMQDIAFTKQEDKASPQLMLYCASGKHIKKATLHIHRATGKKEKYLEFVFSDSIVTSYQTSATTIDVLPMDSFTLNFAKIEVTYSELDHKTGKSKGDVKKWCDTVINKGG